MYRIVVTDDDILNRKAADRILSFNGYEVVCISSGEELVEYMKSNTPDLILLDVHMTGMDGFETMRQLKSGKYSRSVPVIFLTADDDAETETKALAAGAMDFVAKPFVATVLLLRVRNTIELFRLQNGLKEEVREKNDEVLRQLEKNERLSLQIVQTLAGTIDAKDTYTKGHSARVAKYAKEIAKRSGMSAKACEDIYMMGLLHDVGKIGVPDTVINKPSKLTEEEFELIKSHPVVGYNILKNISEMPKLAIGARWHHERYDGKGYPDGLKGMEIPVEARIIAVADAYDAMSSRRSYHEMFAQEYIRGEFMKCRGTQFDPAFAEIMLEMIEEDKDYRMCEAASEADNPEDDTVFGFLSMLEAGGIDTAVGMKYCMNDVEFYKEMLHEFVSNISDREVRLTISMENRDMEKYRNYVHSLKSAALTVGAVRLHDKAKELEEAAVAQRSDLVSIGHELLVSLMQQVTGGILMSLGMYE
ncbi:putative two-component system response regulator [Ruminococcus sp. YE71]|uniref:HD domain-containing phosphohydrolase n=1 Tax=unclassified Ruminococcus TaxID=2608920 RepID=UPI00088ADE79|nr:MULTISPECIES: HD domain-containing phosphohydrolase [unclassified Ruminococcus]SDA19077.1 putative two-component system response regulator [Ruminococcus sp. YE78]SFW28755.1 putative two-component system response regulator [Ruminococcus sp. YE71]